MHLCKTSNPQAAHGITHITDIAIGQNQITMQTVKLDNKATLLNLPYHTFSFNLNCAVGY
jgi:hypothetical protein